MSKSNGTCAAQVVGAPQSLDLEQIGCGITRLQKAPSSAPHRYNTLLPIARVDIDLVQQAHTGQTMPMGWWGKVMTLFLELLLAGLNLRSTKDQAAGL